MSEKMLKTVIDPVTNSMMVGVERTERERVCEALRKGVEAFSVLLDEQVTFRKAFEMLADTVCVPPDLAAAIREGIEAARKEGAGEVTDGAGKHVHFEDMGNGCFTITRELIPTKYPVADPTTPPQADEGFTEEEIAEVRKAQTIYNMPFADMANFAASTRIAAICRHLAEQEERELAALVVPHAIDGMTIGRWTSPPADDLAALKKRIGWDAAKGKRLLDMAVERASLVRFDYHEDERFVGDWDAPLWNRIMRDHFRFQELFNAPEATALLRRLVEHDGSE